MEATTRRATPCDVPADSAQAAQALAQQLHAVRVRGEWPVVKQLACRLLDIGTPPQAPVLVALAQACWHLDELGEADAAAARALEIDGALTEALLVRTWVATAQGDGERALACYSRLTALNPAVARWSLQRIQLLNWLGYVKEAVRELEVACRRWPDDPALSTFLHNYGAAVKLRESLASPQDPQAQLTARLMERAPDPAQRLRPLLVDDPDRDVLITPTPDSHTALLVFTGSNDSLSMPLEVFDRYLAVLPATVIYLKDFGRLRFLCGVESLGGEYVDTLAGLRAILRRFGIQHVCTLGNCDGGFAAVRYGVELGAQRMVAFHCPTSCPDESSARFEQARNFKRTRLAARVPAGMSDLRPFLQERAYEGRIDLFYEEQDARDQEQALRVADLKGVHLHPYPGFSNHRLLRQLALSHENFPLLLAQTLGMTHD